MTRINFIVFKISERANVRWDASLSGAGTRSTPMWAGAVTLTLRPASQRYSDVKERAGKGSPWELA